MIIFVCTSYKKELPGKRMNSHFTPTSYILGALDRRKLSTFWVYSVRCRRAHGRSVLEKIPTAPLDIANRTFTPYDIVKNWKYTPSLRSRNLSGTYICKLCVILQSRVLWVVCPHKLRISGRRLPMQLQCGNQGQQGDFSHSVRGN